MSAPDHEEAPSQEQNILATVKTLVILVVIAGGVWGWNAYRSYDLEKQCKIRVRQHQDLKKILKNPRFNFFRRNDNRISDDEQNLQQYVEVQSGNHNIQPSVVSPYALYDYQLDQPSRYTKERINTVTIRKVGHNGQYISLNQLFTYIARLESDRPMVKVNKIEELKPVMDGEYVRVNSKNEPMYTMAKLVVAEDLPQQSSN